MIYPEYPEIDFIDETQREYEARIVEVKKTWAKLDKELPKEDIFVRDRRSKEIYREAQRNLLEIPKLIKFVDKKMPNLPEEAEERVKRWSNG